ncbi:MAG: hypothetical protein HKO66_04885 [Saprospiraceae bacterium]|nr:hypothetical protein [Bacteroidia bacterium]NNL91547.1 hypothetical protein [Saprospiraceae bacterium]
MDRYTHIESYLMNVLSSEDKAAFELEMSQDPQLKADVEAHAKMKSALDGLVEHDVKAVLDAENNQTASDPIPMPTIPIAIGRRKFIPIAASILVLVSVGWWVNKPTSTDRIFENYCKEPIGFDTRSGENVQIDSITKMYFDTYKLIKENKFQEAYNIYSSSNIPKDHKLHDNYEWFSALTLLKLDREKAIEKFELLSKNQSHKYSKKIREILEELR